MRTFESINIGDKAELTHIITQDDINSFVELTGDDNKLHVDRDYAQTTSLKKNVAHGMLGASFISTVIGTKLPGDGALWHGQNLEFLLPIRIGDRITIKVEVVKKTQKNQTVELLTEIFNQHKNKVTTGTAKVKIVAQEASKIDKECSGQKKVALVVGGTGGIGQVCCLQLARDGFDVAIHYHKNKAVADKLKKQIVALGQKAITVQGDINNPAQTQEMVINALRRLENIMAVVNCSTLNLPKIKFNDLEWEEIEKQFSLNVRGTFNILKSVVPVMEENKYGKFVNLNTLAIEQPNSEWSHYITAKSALNGFSKALAIELAPKGIRINQVSPGMTETDLIADIPEKAKLLVAAKTPLRRLALPQDIAGAISFLVSEKSDYLTGETIRVNGGQLMA